MSTSDRLSTGNDVRDEDLPDICEEAGAALSALFGTRLLITGGAGFLGYYLMQTALHWNTRDGQSDPIDVTVFDNCARGWTTTTASTGSVTCSTCIPQPARWNAPAWSGYGRLTHER